MFVFICGKFLHEFQSIVRFRLKHLLMKMKSGVTCFLIVTQLLMCIEFGACTAAITNCRCSGENWFPFESKCFKLIKRQATREEAELLCNGEYLHTYDDSEVPTLASIKSAAEQTFLTKLISETSGVEGNVWIGAKRIEKENQVVWNDDSLLEFTNWAEGSPSGQTGNDCTEMQSRRNETELQRGLWRDVACGGGNYAVCEKSQCLRREIRDIRKELSVSRTDSEQSFTGLQKQLNDLQNQLEVQKKQLEGQQTSSVPIGFVYVQLSNQPEPWSLWPQTQWENISPTYAGLFFRVIGGDSAAFGETQGDNAPRISEIRNHHDHTLPNHHIDVPANGEWTTKLWTGTDLWCVNPDNPCNWSMFFKQTAGEVRPRNQAVQIWKRIK